MRTISFRVAALFVAILCVSPRPAVADAIVTVKAPTSVAPGSSFAVDINIANVSDLYGFQFDLSFDPAVLSATSGTEGALLPGGGAPFFIPGSVDNTAGLVTATADTLQGAIPRASGSGTLVVFDCTSLAAGTSNLGILNVTLLDSSLSPIPETTVGGSVTVGSTASVPEPSSLYPLLIGACAFTICFCGRPALSLRARRGRRCNCAFGLTEQFMMQTSANRAAFGASQCRGRLRAALLLICFVLAASAFGQQLAKRLTNQDVISMVAGGLSDDVIIAKIRATSAAGADNVHFDTSVDGIKALKAANVPDSVIQVMINPAPAPAVIVAASAPMTLDPNLPPPEVGIYWKDGANFMLVQGRTVTQAKVGGRAGAFFTNGMRSEHWDATIEGPTSQNRLKDRHPVFYFYVADGTTASDYVLIKLEKKSDHREFQVGSFGGVTGGKSGVKRDKEISFKAEHVAIRTYRIMLDADLKPGEYGFFMGTGAQATMAGGGRGSARSGGSASGRIYDFTIPE